MQALLFQLGSIATRFQLRVYFKIHKNFIEASMLPKLCWILFAFMFFSRTRTQQQEMRNGKNSGEENSVNRILEFSKWPFLVSKERQNITDHPGLMRSQQLNPIRIGSHQIVIREVRGLTHENGLTFIIIQKTRRKTKCQKNVNFDCLE